MAIQTAATDENSLGHDMRSGPTGEESATAGLAPFQARVRYGGWHIHYDPPPIPVRDCDWQFYHDDFDGAPDANDNRCGFAGSLEAAKAEIDMIEEEARS